MHARVNIIFGRQDRVEDGVVHLEESDRVVVEGAAGNRGLTTLVDREAGVIVAVSYWDEPIRSSEAALTRAREGAAAAAGGDLLVESYEVVWQEEPTRALPGATVRMERVQIDPARVGIGMAFIRDEVLGELRGHHGFCGAEFLVDRETGSGLLLTRWTAGEAAAGVESTLGRLRHDAVERFGTKFPRTETYTLAGASAPN
jgi:hypothetical protein